MWIKKKQLPRCGLWITSFFVRRVWMAKFQCRCVVFVLVAVFFYPLVREVGVFSARDVATACERVFSRGLF